MISFKVIPVLCQKLQLVCVWKSFISWRFSFKPCYYTSLKQSVWRGYWNHHRPSVSQYFL